MIYVCRSNEPKRETDHNNGLYSTDERIVATADYRSMFLEKKGNGWHIYLHIHTHTHADVNLFRSP
jgi:hypothetical protein